MEQLRKLGRDPFKLLNKQHQELYTSVAKIESECKALKAAKKLTNGTSNGKSASLTNGGGSAKDEDDDGPNTLTIDDSSKDDHASLNGGVKEEDGGGGLDSTQDVNMKSVNGDEGDEKMGSQEAKSGGEAMVVLE